MDMIVHSDHPKSTAMAFGLGVEVAAYGCALHAIFFFICHRPLCLLPTVARVLGRGGATVMPGYSNFFEKKSSILQVYAHMCTYKVGPLCLFCVLNVAQRSTNQPNNITGP